MLTYAPVAASEAAACVARHARSLGQEAGLDAQKVENLLFLCQGYSLAAHGAPLFTGRLWATDAGVSCPAAAEPIDEPGESAEAGELNEVVARVWAKFGGLNPQLLRMRVANHARCVREMSGRGADLSASPEALARAFTLAVKQGLI